MRRKSLVAVAVVVVGVGAAGIAYAAIPGADGTVQGCYTKLGGILRVVDSSSQCKNFETPISWSQKGQKGDPGTNGINGLNGAPGSNGVNGAPGISPTVAQLSPGDANCPAGGAAITDSTGSTAYVCSGQNGQAGANGQPFSGTFTSPNGLYSISVTDAGISITGTAGAHILLHNNDLSVRSGTVAVDAGTTIQVRSGTTLGLQAGTDISVRASRDFAVLASANASISGSGLTSIQGGNILLNGTGCQPAARAGDPVVGVAVGNPGAVTGNVAAGSATVCIGG